MDSLVSTRYVIDLLLLAGVHKQKRSSAPPTAPAAAPCTDGETYANKATWVQHSPADCRSGTRRGSGRPS